MSVTVTVTKKYLVFPVRDGAVSKNIVLYEDGRVVFDFNCMLDQFRPDFYAYIDVSRFLGRTVTLAVTPEMPIPFTESDVMDLPGLWQEPYRPQVHFTVKNGWNNDPNGLIYYGGKYHMFFQHNPCSVRWGNMHWGHAVSDDLLHWEEKDIALFPDEMGTMYSGSAIADTKNVTGLGRDGAVPLLLYYTAAANTILSAGKKHTQCMAYSLDGGATFQKYEGNPILGHIEASNRDPKVVWVEEISRYVMAIYLVGNRYLLFTSADLIHFEKYQEITLQGDVECPDLFPLMHGGKKYWILSGARNVYVLGRFTADGFIIESGETQLFYDGVSYAAQSYSGIPDGRIVRLWWNTLQRSLPHARFSQQMGIPGEMHLSEAGGKLYLCAQPVRELESLRRGGAVLEDFTLEQPHTAETGYVPVDLTLKAPWDGAAALTLSLFGHSVVLDMTCNQCRFGPDRTKRMPLSADGKSLDIRIVIDRCTAEIYADGGRFCTSVEMFADENLPRIVLSADRPVQIDRLAWYELASVHN